MIKTHQQGFLIQYGGKLCQLEQEEMKKAVTLNMAIKKSIIIVVAMKRPRKERKREPRDRRGLSERQAIVMKMNKKQFIDALKAVSSQYREDKKISLAINCIVNQDFGCAYFDTKFALRGLIKLLEHISGDKHKWIDYWVYELQCGDKYERGMIKEKNGKNIKLKTEEDVYNLLFKGKK